MFSARCSHAHEFGHRDETGEWPRVEIRRAATAATAAAAGGTDTIRAALNAAATRFAP